MDLRTSKCIHIFIMIALTFVIALCPPIGAITPFGMKVLGAFAGVLYGWLFIDLLYPSIWAFAAIPILGLMNATNALKAGFGNDNLVVVIVAMAFAGALEAIGVTKVISNWILTKKLFQKSPWFLVIGLVLTAFVLGLAGASVAAVLILWQIVSFIAEKNHLPKNDPFISFVVIMIAIGAYSGMFALPFHAISLIFTGYFVQAVGSGFEVGPFTVVAFASFLATIGGMIVLGKFVFRFDAGKFAMSEEMVQKMKEEKATREEKMGMLILVLYIAGIVLPSVFPNMPGGAVLLNLGIGGMSLVGMLVIALVQRNKKGVVDLAKAWTNGIAWPLILLLAATFPLADLMKSPDAGIMATIMGTVGPAVAHMNEITFIIVVMVALGLLTQFTHNIVLGAMFIPFLIPLYAQMGGNIYTFFMIIFFSLNASYATPAASFQSGMVHGMDRMSSKWAYILGFAFLVLTWIVNIVITLPLGNYIFQ